ncbi:Ig-like domain-containing protein, partial [uncultured Anaerococcus sp.]|uniref:Ig-like domain-containing protein n=1 Tax=uncultured Anaerococcus sp. TaxID=293428 RepID=UPI0028040C3B
PNTTVFVTAQAENKEESARIPVVVQVDKDGNGTADKDERTTIKSVIARNIGTGEPKVPATFTTIEGVAEPGSTVTIKFTPKAEEGQTATEVTKTVKANAQTGEYELELKAGENELTNNIPLPADTVVKAQAKFGDKKDSPTIVTKVFEDLNADGKDDNAANQKTDRPTAKALNVGTDPKVTTITGKAEKGATVVAKVGDIIVGTTTADSKGDYKIEATKTGQANGGAIDKDTPVQVTAQVTGKLVSDPETAIVKMDKDGNGVADDEEQFNIKKATDVKILQNPSKMKYSVETKDGKANFDASGLLIEVSDGSGKSKTYTYAEITSEANKKNFTLSPADKAEIGLGENGAANEIPFKVTVTGADKHPTVEANEKVKVILDADGNGKHDQGETTTITSVIARNIGTGTTSPKTKATFTTIEGVAEPGSTVTITFTEKGKSEATTKTVEANKTTGAYKLELKGATEAENILLPAETEVKASAKFGDKKPSGEITTKVFEDLDADGKADNPNANKTERPSAIAYNFKDEAKTTIKGEAEPGAKVIAKVGKTIVGEATANSDGKYEISATKDNAKLPKGTKVSVTATLAPKGESPAQETVVYEDLDGDGQPDTSQAFDKDKIRGLEVVASPNKMVYNNKEQLNLTGMKVLLTDQMGNMKIVEFSEFQTYGIKVDPLNNIELSDKNVADGGHNGKKIKAEVKVAVGNSEKTYSGETPTALVVNKDQSAQPTDVEAANQGTKTTTTVRGKATPGAKVEVKNAKGGVIGTVEKVDDTGKFEVEVTKQADKAKVKVTATEPGKAESAPQEAKVFRDKNGDWKDDKGGKVEIEKPVVDPIKVGDESVKVKIPGEGITKITVKDEKGKTIDVVKDGNDWKVDGKIVGKDGDKLVIPTKDKGLDFGAYEKVEITNHDDEGNEGKIVVATKPANLKPMEKPTIDPISTQSTKITGKSLPGSKVLVYLPGDTDDTAREASVKSDGSFELVINSPLADKSIVKVKATNTQRDGVGEAETKVGLNTKQLEDTKTEADGLINDSKTNNNFDPDNNKYDKNLEDKTKAAQDILERAKDNKDDNDPTQTQVNTAEKELRDAINQKNADDKVKVVEKAVKDGQKPSEDQINEAQEAIDKVADTTAKKELQDRLDKAKLIDELKGKVDNAPKDDKDHPEYKTKPSDVIKALEDAKKEAEKVIKDYKDGTTIAEKTPEEAKKALDDAIADYNKEQVVVSFKRPVSGSKRLIIHSLQDYVTIEIYVAGQRKLETKTLLTSSVGGLTVTLEEALKSGQEVKIIGKKINLQDGESTLDVK